MKDKSVHLHVHLHVFEIFYHSHKPTCSFYYNIVEFPSGTLSGDDLLNSPDGLGPGASKRVALNESSDMSSDKSASATPSPSSSGRIRKKLFTRKTKRQYSILRGKGQEGGKFEKGF